MISCSLSCRSSPSRQGTTLKGNNFLRGEGGGGGEQIINFQSCIMKTCLYKFDPVKPHFYIVKLGYRGVYIIFLISAQNINCWYLLEPPRRGCSNESRNLCFEQKYEKYQSFCI